MPNKIVVTSRNVEEFKEWQDAITMEKFVVGDTIVRCATCRAVFHQSYVSGNCPLCQQTFIPSEVCSDVLHLSTTHRLEKKTVPSTVKRRHSSEDRQRLVERRWRLASNALLAISITGLIVTLLLFMFYPQHTKALEKLRLIANNQGIVFRGRQINTLMERITLSVGHIIGSLFDKGKIMLGRITRLLPIIWATLVAIWTTFTNTPVQEWPKVFFGMLKN